MAPNTTRDFDESLDLMNISAELLFLTLRYRNDRSCIWPPRAIR
jgi:hypothetical protein